MVIQTIKKLLAIFIVFSMWFFQILGYTFDNLFVSYNSNSSSNTYLVHLSKIDYQKVTSQTKNYKFLDGSHTSISLKWLNISKNKLDFLTNYKWLISYNSEKSFDINLKKSKTNSSPIREYLITLNNNWKLKDKEKLLKQKDFFEFNNVFEYENYIELKEFVLTKTPDLPYGLRAPPYIISLTMI